MSGGSIAEAIPEAESLQLLARLEAKQFAVNRATSAQNDLTQHLDALRLGARIGLEGNMLGQPFYGLLIVPVVWSICHTAGRFLAV